MMAETSDSMIDTGICKMTDGRAGDSILRVGEVREDAISSVFRFHPSLFELAVLVVPPITPPPYVEVNKKGLWDYKIMRDFNGKPYSGISNMPTVDVLAIRVQHTAIKLVRDKVLIYKELEQLGSDWLKVWHWKFKIPTFDPESIGVSIDRQPRTKASKASAQEGYLTLSLDSPSPQEEPKRKLLKIASILTSWIAEGKPKDA